MDRWTEIELFVRIAELGNMGRAAEQLGLSGPAATRHLSSLETRLGARLVQRTTRSLSLTEVGREYFETCKRALEDLDAAGLCASATALEPSGVLKITASLSFAVQHLAPLLTQYTQRYPKVSIKLDSANRYSTLIDNDVDIAFRTREFESDSSITIRRLAQTRRVVCASPGYLDRQGRPEDIEALAHRPMLIYTLSRNPHELTFTRGQETRSVRIQGLLEANDGQILRAAALNGLGLLIQPRYIVYDDLVAGRLVPVLDEWDLPRLQINVAFHSRRHLSAKVRTFVDFVADHFARNDFERKWTASTRETP
jgi:DNA-binding transcriptional LysR family regulator